MLFLSVLYGAGAGLSHLCSTSGSVTGSRRKLSPLRSTYYCTNTTMILVFVNAPKRNTYDSVRPRAPSCTVWLTPLIFPLTKNRVHIHIMYSRAMFCVPWFVTSKFHMYLLLQNKHLLFLIPLFVQSRCKLKHKRVPCFVFQNRGTLLSKEVSMVMVDIYEWTIPLLEIDVPPLFIMTTATFS